MRVALLMAGMALVASVAVAGEAGRFRPATPDYVVLRVPASASNDPIAMLEQRHGREPENEAVASELAQLYLARARADREPRYFARAEALVKPWASLPSQPTLASTLPRAAASATAGPAAPMSAAPSSVPEPMSATVLSDAVLMSASTPPNPAVRASTLRVQADILQNRHDFASAVTLLDRAIALSPRDPSARLMRASVKLVGGHAAEARSDCASVLAAGESTTGTICLAQVLGATGGLARADALVKTLISRDEMTLPGPSRGASPAVTAAPVRAWALWVLADFADRAGDSRAAEAYLRAALSADPQSEGIRSALSDVLLDRGAYGEALALVDLPAPSIGLLARRARAQQPLRDPARDDTRAQIDNLVSLAARRGDPPHLREEALVALDVDHDASRALELARANFATQRETIDIRLLIRAARASGDTATLRSVAQWIRETGYEDHQLPGAAT